jgi:hypothetical protein
MNRNRGIVTGVILAISSVFFFIFIGFPLFNQQPSDQGNSPFSSMQSPDSVSTIASDIDSCVSSPNSDCDQEMSQISQFCSQNKGQEQTYPFCSDTRIQMYIEQRNINQIKVNGGVN